MMVANATKYPPPRRKRNCSDDVSGTDIGSEGVVRLLQEGERPSGIFFTGVVDRRADGEGQRASCCRGVPGLLSDHCIVILNVRRVAQRLCACAEYGQCIAVAPRFVQDPPSGVLNVWI